MRKLIELDAALNGVANLLDYEIFKGHSGAVSRAGVVHILTTLQPVDAVPVKHGRWITHEFRIDGYAHACCECTACGASRPITLFPLNYCPHCGAKMDGERKEGDSDG